jgi:methanogenic corrinoid protein MtbC1
MEQLGKEASEYLSRNADRLTEDIIKCQLQVQPNLKERYGAKGYEFYQRDIKHHLQFLRSALTYLSKGLFGSYIEWVQRLLIDLNIPPEDITINFQCFRRVFETKAPGPLRDLLVEFMDAGLSLLENTPTAISSYLAADFPLSDLATQYLEVLQGSDAERANQLIQEAIQSGVDIRDIYLQVLENVQLEVGRLWHANQLSVAEEHYITRITQQIMDSLQQHFQPPKRITRKMVASCVPGELHELGLRMVSDFFKLSGWEVYLTGANTPINDIIKTLKKQHANLLAISVTIPWHVIEAEKLISQIRQDPELRDLKIIVGGRVFTLDPQLWTRIGADEYAPNPKAALEAVEKLF